MTRTAQHDPAERASFAISRRELDGATAVVAAEGDLDLAAAPTLKWTLMEARGSGATRVVVDMTDAGFIDSTAIGVLVSAQRSLPEGAGMALAGARPDVRAVFELTGLDSTFEMFGTLDEALRWAREGGAATA